jgi:gamma-glutamyltranspeptidase / glutathione hydrolase / leukotriene-C4 hydrolase
MGLGDPFDPYCASSAAEVADMLSAIFAGQLRANTSDTLTQQPAAYGGKWNPLPGGGGYVPTDHGTTHLSVIDAQRNALGLTSTINTGFGSKVLSPSTGMVLNDEMDDFSTPGQPNAYNLAPSRANFIMPGKRPLSSMSPTIVLDTASGAVRAVVGASGGPRIITATAQTLLNLVALGMDPGLSVRSPRLHHQLLPNVAYYEATPPVEGSQSCVVMPDGVLAALRRRNHSVSGTTSTGVVQMVAVDLETGALHAVSDQRKGGEPAGF